MDGTPISATALDIPERVSMPRRPDWRIGMIGFGGIARNAHAPAYRQMGWPIVAVADVDPVARQAAREQFGIEAVYDDWRDLVADERVEVVDLLTHPTLRLPVVEAAAAARKPLITEKPFGRTSDECERMVRVAAAAGVALGVHQNYRWFPACFAAHHLVANGWIGNPYFVSIEIYGQQDVQLAGHPFYSTCDDFLTLQWNNHLADLLRYWTGKDARRVLARTGRMLEQTFRSDNLLIAIADFGDGLTSHIVHSELLRSSLGSQPCRIDGSAGSVTFDLWGRDLAIESGRLGSGARSLDLSAAPYPSTFACTMGDFLSSVEGASEPTVSGRRNLATIRTILAEHESAAAGGTWVSVPGSDP